MAERQPDLRPVIAAETVEPFSEVVVRHHQRYIERNIRKYKRLAAGSLDKQNVERYKRKVSEWSVRMEELLDAYPELRRARTREVDRTMAV